MMIVSMGKDAHRFGRVMGWRGRVIIVLGLAWTFGLPVTNGADEPAAATATAPATQPAGVVTDAPPDVAAAPDEVAAVQTPPTDDDGPSYPISQFVLEYATPNPSLPAVDAIMNAPILLG